MLEAEYDLHHVKFLTWTKLVDPKPPKVVYAVEKIIPLQSGQAINHKSLLQGV